MKINIDGPYREKRGLAQELRAYIMIAKIIAITAILLIGIHTINQLDEVMTQQAIQDKTLTDAMDQLMWIRMDLDLIDLQLEELLLMDKPEIVDSSQFFLTEDERTLIERICMAEASPQDVVAMAAVAQTIRNRAELWGYTIKEVCLAPSQYANPKQGEITPEAVQAVWAVFDEGLEILDGPATHFHSEKITEPYWTESKVCRGSVGGNRFWY